MWFSIFTLLSSGSYPTISLFFAKRYWITYPGGYHRGKVVPDKRDLVDDTCEMA